MKNWFSDGSRGNQLDEVRFANGTVRTAAQINTRALEVNGTTAADTISGEQFKTSNGKTLLDSQVQNLVDAMASFSPPAAGQTTLLANYASSLNTVIATNWQ